MKILRNISQRDAIQIALNVLAFLILFFATGGQGSFWGFLTFNLGAMVILAELALNDKRTGRSVWITKTVTYLFLCAKFYPTRGELRNEYIWMISISIISLVLSRTLIKKRDVSAWGQVVAYCIGAYMYIGAIFEQPEHFTYFHMVFWLVNCISYCILIIQVKGSKHDRADLIVPWYGAIMSAIYISCMAHHHLISFFGSQKEFFYNKKDRLTSSPPAVQFYYKNTTNTHMKPTITTVISMRATILMTAALSIILATAISFATGIDPGAYPEFAYPANWVRGAWVTLSAGSISPYFIGRAIVLTELDDRDPFRLAYGVAGWILFSTGASVAVGLSINSYSPVPALLYFTVAALAIYMAYRLWNRLIDKGLQSFVEGFKEFAKTTGKP